jgi:hypothetical protein
MTTVDQPNCSICGKPLMLLPETTQNKGLPVWACDSGKEADGRVRPCDGALYRNAIKS